MASSPDILNAEYVRASVDTCLVRLTVSRGLLERQTTDGRAPRAMLQIEVGKAVHVFGQLPPVARPDTSSVPVAFAVPMALMTDEALFHLGLGSAPAMHISDLQEGTARSARRSGERSPGREGAQERRRSNEQLVVAQSARTGELEVQLRHAWSVQEDERAARRGADRQERDIRHQEERKHAEAVEEIAGLRSRIAELEATIADLVEELRVISRERKTDVKPSPPVSGRPRRRAR